MKETDSKVYTGKDEITLVEPIFIRMVARALMYGNTKHEPNSWKYCTDIKLYKDAAARHLLDYVEGKYYDDGDNGSGLPHLAHAGANIMILLWLEERERKNAERLIGQTKEIQKIGRAHV